MNIISSKKIKNRIIDGIHTILSLPEEDYRLLIEKITPKIGNIEGLFFYYPTDDCEIPTRSIQIGLEKYLDENGRYICRAYYGHEDISMFQIISECKNMLKDYPIESVEYSKLNEIIHSRDIESFKSYYSKRENVNPKLIDKIFQILSSDEVLDKFLSYDNNSDFFDIDDQKIPKSEYLKHLGWIFGSKDENGFLNNTNSIFTNFFILNFQELKNRYSQIYDNTNMERYINPWYTFSISLPTNRIIRDGIDFDWNVSPEVYKEIFENMPPDLSLEEQAIYIYCKMCIMFLYDEGYLYRDKINKVNYDSTFSKKHLEELVPGNKVTCYDFSRMCAKLINELDGDIKAVVILEGKNDGHASVGFYTENVSVTLDAINISSDDRDGSNDLMKAKNGIKLKGIKIISDRDGIIVKAIDKVYPQVLEKKPNTINEYIQRLKSIPQEENVQNIFSLKLQSLLDIMKSNNIYGNEFTQTLWIIAKTNYFGDGEVEQSYLGELIEDDAGNKRYKRHIVLRIQKQEEDNSSKEVYLIDTDTLNLKICSKEDIIKMLNSGKMIYECEKHKLLGIDKEVNE